MDTVFAQAVTRIIELPTSAQRMIGEALLQGQAEANLPVIEFTAEEDAMIAEGISDLEAGQTYTQAEMEETFDALRAKSYAAV